MTTPRDRANIVPINWQSNGQKAGERGRATKYDPVMCDGIKVMAQDGMFPEEWCAHLGVAYSTMMRWANEHAEFYDAIIIAWHLLHAHYTAMARDNLRNPDFRVTLFLELVRKRFPDSWGKNARNTQGHFEALQAEMNATGEIVTPEASRAMTAEERDQAIAQLLARRQAEAAGG